MQQAKGPTGQVNYNASTKSPSKSEQNWGLGNFRSTKTPPKLEQNESQDLSNHQSKIDTSQYCTVPHKLTQYAQLETRDALGKAVGELDTFFRACSMGAPPYPAPLRHSIMMPLKGSKTSLRWISNQKSMPKVSTAQYKILIARWWAVHSSAT